MLPKMKERLTLLENEITRVTGQLNMIVGQREELKFLITQYEESEKIAAKEKAPEAEAHAVESAGLTDVEC